MSPPMPAVFISSTCYDLKQVRSNLRTFVESMGFEAILSEFDSFPVDPNLGTFENCRKAVEDRADLFVLIVGGRYGSVTSSGKSITNVEYLQAKAKGLPINVFVSRQILDVMPVWKLSPDADFSSAVDSPKLFEFVSSLYHSGNVWVYPFDYAETIVDTLRKQWAYLIKDALDLRRRLKGDSFSDNLRTLPAPALRILIEKPDLWEYIFFSELFSWNVAAARDDRKDLERKISIGSIESLSPKEAMDCINDKMKTHFRHCNMLTNLVNSALKEALGPAGSPACLEDLDYIARRIGEVYRAEIHNALGYGKAIVDKEFNYLFGLAKESSLDLVHSIDQGQERLKIELASLKGTLSSYTFISLGDIGAEAPYGKLTEEFKRLAKEVGWTPKAV
jgi:hypothetical protein